MKVLIIEDEHFAAEKLEQMVLEINPSISVAAKTGSIKESVKWLMNNSVDLIFLDIQLSDGISFSIFEQVMINTPVIFTTAYDQYAIKAFQLNSIAYLLKPIRRIELEESLQKYQTLKSAFSIDFETLLANIQGREPDYKKRFLIQLGEKIRKVEIGEIAYFFVLEKAVYLRTFQGKSYPVDYTLDKLESLINPEKFFRINRKYIVSIDSINNMVAYSRSRVK
ncbi:MAG TPA: LytTR family DNA-binding domain-containing protein, partial [Draconibacterium sp.]|nr:LytTR family DNA-binding domain-containing protein [Draconibacterium sp.]